jgi:phospholipase/lecithinase/hemolysin
MLLLSLAATLVVVGAAPHDAYADHFRFTRDFSNLYVFGDSLSDPGNTYFINGEINEAPWEAIPEEPYESRRFTNGKTWVDTLAKATRNYRGALPAYRRDWFGNYAVAGARAQGVGAEKPSFGDQVLKYLGVTGGSADPDALYVVQFGGNDIRDALESAQVGGDPFVVIGGAIQALAYNITVLSNAGARKFLVANAPNLGKAPVIAALGAQVPAEQLSAGYNMALDGLLMQLSASGLEIYRLDLFSFVTVAAEMPHGFGFADATTPCLQVFAPPATGVCEDPDQRLFWDGIHPTRAGHRLVGSIAVNSLSLR